MKRRRIQEAEAEESDDDRSARESTRQRQLILDTFKEFILPEMETLMETLIRRVMQEERKIGLSLNMPSACSWNTSGSLHCACTHLQNLTPPNGLPVDQIQASATSRWKLQFKNELPAKVFTGSRIESKDKTPVQIVILETASRNMIKSGPLSSIKIEILVLDGNFGVDEEEGWTQKQFLDNVVTERESKRRLLTGDRFITLKDGIGELGDVTITDISGWTKNGKFRLGARALQSNLEKGRIQEARSGAFAVKDRRGKQSEKHYPPLLSDDVWRLEKIKKDGKYHERLTKCDIKTVQDFLKSQVMDQDKLRSIFDNTKSNNAIWEAVLEHAKQCDLGPRRYSYHVAEQQVVLVFNSIFEVVEAEFGGQRYQHLDDLTSSQQDLVHKLKQLAYEDKEHIYELQVDSHLRPLPTGDAVPVPEPRPLDLQIPNFPTVCQGELDAQACSKGPLDPVHNEPLIDSSQMEVISSWPSFCPVQELASSLNNYNVDKCVLVGPNMTSENGSVSISYATLECGTSTGKHLSAKMAKLQQIRWFKLKTALKFGMVIRKRVAAKTLPLDLDYGLLEFFRDLDCALPELNRCILNYDTDTDGLGGSSLF